MARKNPEVAATDVTSPIETGADASTNGTPGKDELLALFQDVKNAYQALNEAEEQLERDREETLAGYREAINAAVQRLVPYGKEWQVAGQTYKVRAMRGADGEMLGMTGFRPTAPKTQKPKMGVVEL